MMRARTARISAASPWGFRALASRAARRELQKVAAAAVVVEAARDDTARAEPADLPAGDDAQQVVGALLLLQQHVVAPDVALLVHPPDARRGARVDDVKETRRRKLACAWSRHTCTSQPLNEEHQGGALVRAEEAPPNAKGAPA